LGNANTSAAETIEFSHSAIAAKGRQIFYLYYGNKNPPAQIKRGNLSGQNLPLVPVTVGAEETLSDKAPKPFSRSVDDWLKQHGAEEFDGQVWARMRIDTPKDFLYNVVIDSETNPYLPARQATGTVSYYGLQPKNWAPTENDWGKPLAWIAPTDDSDWLKAGQYSAWVKLPTSTAAQWHTAFFVMPKTGTGTGFVILHLEFASQPAEDFIFHTVDEKTDEKGAVVVRMPTTGGLKGLPMLESFTEWATRRRALVQSLKLTAPPKPSKIKIGTWTNMLTYREGGGNATRERAEIDFQNFHDLGINSLSVTNGLSDSMFRDLAGEYGIIDTTITQWADAWQYSHEGYNLKLYDYQAGETPPQRWQRVFDDYYRRRAEDAKKNTPFAYSISTHINLGDEIAPATTATAILQTPQLLSYFRNWLKQQGLTPALLGAANWESVEPADERAKLNAPNAPIEYARRFYHTRRFINHYTALYFRSATEAVEKYYPQAAMIAVNYQAGPMQFGFVGNNNDLDKGQIDIFELGRMRAFKGVMMEDWVHGWDLGVGREALAAEMMRAAGRRHDLPLASYLVGGEAIRAEYFTYLMRGIKENGLYLYGPISNIGPAWSDDINALAQVADTTRQVKKFEHLIAPARLRPAKVALLVATTSDIMQVKGLYFCPERQNLFIAMQHAYVPVEVVSEQDIAEDERLKDYSLLMVTDPQVRNDVQRKIADWVKGGGRLWASVGAMSRDEYNQPSRVLNDVFGVKNQTIIMQDGGIQPAAESWSPNVSKFSYKQLGTIKTDSPVFGANVEIPVWGAKLDCAPSTAQIIGAYEDGKPAVFLNRYGKGEAMLVGALVGEAYVRARYPENLIKEWTIQEGWKFESGAEARTLAAGLVNGAQIIRPVSLSVPGVYTSVMETAGATLVFLNNATGRKLPQVTVRLQGLENARRVESTRRDKIDYRVEENKLVLEMPLENTDIICIYR
ncbi:MAG TPA: beta-galactosidase trimerization domain-containing protein, partial [Pyrinomonadaceae bacterium]